MFRKKLTSARVTGIDINSICGIDILDVWSFKSNHINTCIRSAIIGRLFYKVKSDNLV